MMNSHQSTASTACPPAGSDPAGAADPLDSALRRLGEDILAEPLPDSLLDLLLPRRPAVPGT